MRRCCSRREHSGRSQIGCLGQRHLRHAPPSGGAHSSNRGHAMQYHDSKHTRNILPPPGSVEPEGKQVQTMGRGSILRRHHRAWFLRTKNVYKRGEEEIRKRRWWLGGEPARRRLGRATVAELLRLRHHSRRDSERADQARSESLRNLLASTNRSPAIGLRSCSSGTVRQPLHLSPIAGERLVLVQWLREDSRRAC